MSNKISATINVSKIDRTKLRENEYIDKHGEVKREFLLEIDVVPLKEPKVIKSTPNYTMSKTHFVAERQTKEERDSGKETNYLGSGIQYSDPLVSEPSSPQDNVDPEDIPF